MAEDSLIRDLLFIGAAVLLYVPLLLLVAWLLRRFVRRSARGMINLALILLGLFMSWVAYDMMQVQIGVRRDIAESVKELDPGDRLHVSRIGPLITSWSNFNLRNDDGTVKLQPGIAAGNILDLDLVRISGLTGTTVVLACPFCWLSARRQCRKSEVPQP